MSTFTPGPWFYEPEDRGDYSVGIGSTAPYIYADPDGDGNVYPVCTLDNPCRRANRKPVDEYDECLEWSGDHVANARLIAAAPEMYEALQEAARVLSDLPSTNQAGTRTRAAWERIRAVLAKVDGCAAS